MTVTQLPLPWPLEPIARATSYTAVAGQLVLATGAIQISLPSPVRAGIAVGVISVNGTGAAPCTVTGGGGLINGPGAGTSSILLGDPGAYVVLVSDGTNWNIVAGAQDSGWITVGSGGTAPAFQNGWGNTASFQVNQFRKIGTIVYIRGAPNGGTGGVAMFTLPAGYRPTSANGNIITPALNAASPSCYVQVTNAGAVIGVSSGAANFHYNLQIDVSP